MKNVFSTAEHGFLLKFDDEQGQQRLLLEFSQLPMIFENTFETSVVLNITPCMMYGAFCPTNKMPHKQHNPFCILQITLYGYIHNLSFFATCKVKLSK